MKHNYRWTVRNLDPRALRVLHEAQELNPERTLGSLVSEAIWDWWDNLPDDPDTEPLDEGDIDSIREQLIAA
jgi:hypothetical protein